MPWKLGLSYTAESIHSLPHSPAGKGELGENLKAPQPFSNATEIKALSTLCSGGKASKSQEVFTPTLE